MLLSNSIPRMSNIPHSVLLSQMTWWIHIVSILSLVLVLSTLDWVNCNQYGDICNPYANHVQGLDNVRIWLERSLFEILCLFPSTTTHRPLIDTIKSTMSMRSKSGSKNRVVTTFDGKWHFCCDWYADAVASIWFETYVSICSAEGPISSWQCCLLMMVIITVNHQKCPA